MRSVTDVTVQGLEVPLKNKYRQLGVLMSALLPILLIVLGYMSTVTKPPVTEVSDCPKYTQGYVKDGQVHLCSSQLTMPRNVVINHEVVHLIQEKLGVDTLLPAPVVSYLVHHNLSESEVLPVLVHYSESGYINAELEARLLQKLPDSAIMMMYKLANDYAYLTS